MLKVSGEDLRVSEGWVRCGKCNSAFNASLHLQAMPSVEEEISAPVDAYPPAYQPSLANLVASAFPEEERSSVLRPATPDSSDRQPVANVPEPGPNPGVLRREDSSERPSFSEAPFSYSTRPATRSRWRVVLWLLALGVLVVCLLAGVRHERQALVHRAPAQLSMLNGMCNYSACEVQAPRLLSAVNIEGASLQQVSSSNYTAQLQPKNSGAAHVDLPGEVHASHSASPIQFAPAITRLSPIKPLNVTLILQAPLASADAVVAEPTVSEPVTPNAPMTPAAAVISG